MTVTPTHLPPGNGGFGNQPSPDFIAERPDTGGSCGLGAMPTNRYPAYSTTVDVVVPAGQTHGEATWTAERDTLFTEVSIQALNSSGRGFVDLEYCRTKIFDNVLSSAFAPCCQTKPYFLQGVSDTRKLEIRAGFGDVHPTDDRVMRITFSGFQGEGCC